MTVYLPADILHYSPQSVRMQHTCRNNSLTENEDFCFHCSLPVSQGVDQNVPSPNTLYASVDYSSKKSQTFTNQTISEPPKLKLERKKYAPDGCFTPSTISTTSEQRYSDIDCFSWNRGSSHIDSESADVDAPNNVLSPDAPHLPSISHNAGHNIGMYDQRQSSASGQQDISGQDHHVINSEFDAGLQNEDYIQKSSLRNRPLTAPNIITNVDEMNFDCDSHKQVPDKNTLTLDELTCSLNLYKENSGSQDELHDYAEIYTPNKECSDFYTDNDECVTDDMESNPGKPPTPPLHRFPSEHPKSDPFLLLVILLIHLIMMTLRVTMTTTSSQTTSGDTESSASLGAGAHDISPAEKKFS
ncbi:hypothetical protein CEXT_112001 [Caerostris extrusa]|uniref:Uncharacterized protein n=1 Tax=Caerostris extrusa TaxID=172846 RepID=A0AAV4M9D4_CAEEX|nr:hypothetical protein CEXT_112001 [Caerostris extrusa]